jgi:hypothetical protein
MALIIIKTNDHEGIFTRPPPPHPFLGRQHLPGLSHSNSSQDTLQEIAHPRQAVPCLQLARRRAIDRCNGKEELPRGGLCHRIISRDCRGGANCLIPLLPLFWQKGAPSLASACFLSVSLTLLFIPLLFLPPSLPPSLPPTSSSSLPLHRSLPRSLPRSLAPSRPPTPPLLLFTPQHSTQIRLPHTAAPRSALLVPRA